MAYDPPITGFLQDVIHQKMKTNSLKFIEFIDIQLKLETVICYVSWSNIMVQNNKNRKQCKH